MALQRLFAQRFPVSFGPMNAFTRCCCAALLLVLAVPSLRAQVRQAQPFTDRLTFSAPVTSGFRLGDHLLLNGLFNASLETALPPLNTSGIWFLDVRTGAPLSGTPFHTVVGPDSSNQTSSTPAPGDGLVAYRKGELVRLASDASVQDRWALGANGAVSGMQLHGDTLFLFGGFTQIAGQERRGIAAVNVATRELLAFKPPQFYEAYLVRSSITDVRVMGNRVYAMGTYAVVNGVARSGPVALDRDTGALLPWQPVWGGAPSAALFHDLGALVCWYSQATSQWMCGRYDYTDGSLNLSFTISTISGTSKDPYFAIMGVHGDGWVTDQRGASGMNEGKGLKFFRGDGVLYKTISTLTYEYPGHALYRSFSKYNPYWVFDFHYGNIYAGASRGRLYTMRPYDRDTMAVRQFAHFGGYPEQFSFLGHQVYVSTNPAYVLRVASPPSPSWPSQLPLDMAQQRVDTAFALSVCGTVNDAAPSGSSVYYVGSFRKGSPKRCSGTPHTVARVTATGTVDFTVPYANLWGTNFAGTVLQVETTSRGLLVGTERALYQPDVTQYAAGALGLFNASGQLVPPFFRVTESTNFKPTVRQMRVVGDSLAVITGSFTDAGGQPRNSFAVLRLADGSATAATLPAASGVFEGTGLEVIGTTAYVSGTVGTVAQPIASIPLGAAGSAVCPDVSAGKLLARVGDRLLVATTDRLFALDPNTCERTFFANSDNSFFNVPVTSVLVDGATIWVFGNGRMYAFFNSFPVASDDEAAAQQASNRVRVWPRPSRASVTVEASEVSRPRRLQVVDMLGRTVWTETLGVGVSRAVVDVSGWAAGRYAVRVQTDAGVEVGRGMIVRSP